MNKSMQHEDKNLSSFSSPPRHHRPPSLTLNATLLECTLSVGAQQPTLENKKLNLQFNHKKDLQINLKSMIRTLEFF